MRGGDWALVITAVFTGLATVGGAYATILATRRRLQDDCHAELARVRNENERLARENHELRLRTILEIVTSPVHNTFGEEGGGGDL